MQEVFYWVWGLLRSLEIILNDHLLHVTSGHFVHHTSLVCLVGLTWLRTASMSVGVSVHGVAHSRCFTNRCTYGRGGEVCCMQCELVFLIANAGFGPEIKPVHRKPAVPLLAAAHFMPIHSMSCVSSEQSPFEIHGMFTKAGVSYCRSILPCKQGRTVVPLPLNLKPGSVIECHSHLVPPLCPSLSPRPPRRVSSDCGVGAVSLTVGRLGQQPPFT